MLKMCENALKEVGTFPDKGDLYQDILMKVYFDKNDSFREGNARDS